MHEKMIYWLSAASYILKYFEVFWNILKYSEVFWSTLKYSEIFHSVHSHIVKHLSNYTNQTFNIYSLRIFIVFLLHVSVHHTLSSVRTCVPFTVPHLLSMVTAVVVSWNTKGTIFAFIEITIIYTTVNIAGVALKYAVWKPEKPVIKIFYSLSVCMYWAVIGCCFRGLCTGFMIYVRRPSNYGWVLRI